MATLGSLAVLTLLFQSAPAADGARIPKLRAFLEACARFGFAGSVLVSHGDEIRFAGAAGLADRDRRLANTPDTLFEIASATKPFTAVAILKLEAAGKLGIEDPIHRHLPDVPADKQAITIRHLLTHTSGMPRSAAGGRGDDLAAAVRDYLATPAVRQPGEAHEYWNGGYALLAGIVERVSGTSYMDWCREHIFAPAGMRHTGFTGDPFPGAQVAVGYEGSQPPRTAAEHPYGSYGWHYRGMGGIVTCAGDLHRFARALRGDTLLPAAQRTKLVTPGKGDYACGFYRIAKPRPELTHGGDVRGFHTRFAIYPDDDVCIVVLCNVGEIPTWAIAENLQHLWFGDASRYPAPPAAAAWTDARLQALAGSYELQPGERIELQVEDGSVRLSAAGEQTTQRLAGSVFGTVATAKPELVRDAREILAALAKGEAGPLRARLAPGIPEQWPAMVAGNLWPQRIGKHGAVREVRVLGAIAERGSTTLLFALEQERGASRVKILFAGDRVRILDLEGPSTLASALAVPDTKDQLLRFQWQGPQPGPIGIVRGSDGAVTGLRLQEAIYRRGQ